jgi:hypothetical protein
MLFYNLSCPAGCRPGFTYQFRFGRHRTRRACSLLRLAFLGRMANKPVFSVSGREASDRGLAAEAPAEAEHAVLELAALLDAELSVP